MTLSDWQYESGIPVCEHENGAMYACVAPETSHYYELWRLDDYVVNLVQAGTVWLIKRNEKGA